LLSSCWAWVYVAVFQRALRGLLGKEPTEERAYALACLATLTSVLVAGVFDHHFVDIHFPHVAAMVWLTVGLLVVSLRLTDESIGSASATIKQKGDGLL